MKLELRGITKRFGPLVANDSIDLVVEPGEIHALLGENGAGKSTLMNVLYGLYEPDAGEIAVDDKSVTFAGPGDAIRAGIGMVHQHFMLVPVFSVAENVVLGYEPTSGPGLISVGDARARVKDISDRFGFHVDPDAMVEDLPVGVQQRVEIIKALSRDAEVLILDEPTAVLTPQETDELIGIMRQLKEVGHLDRLHHPQAPRGAGDRGPNHRHPPREGRGQRESAVHGVGAGSMMVGRAVDLRVAKEPANPSEVTFEIKDLTVIDAAGVRQVDNLSLQIARGEILAVAGVQGNGQTELTEAVIGLRRPIAGSITLDGAELVGRSVRDVINSGVGFVPEDRSTDGVIPSFSVAENLILNSFTRPPYSKGVALNLTAVAENADLRMREFDVRAGSAEAPASTLSGGNQQKVVVAREMSRRLQLLVASQPTRGVDVGSIEFIHSRIVAERDTGTPVLIVSTELDEVVALADRIAVMYRGRIVGTVPGDTDRDVLGLMMAGVPHDEAVAQAAEHHTLLGEADLDSDTETGINTSAGTDTGADAGAEVVAGAGSSRVGAAPPLAPQQPAQREEHKP